MKLSEFNAYVKQVIALNFEQSFPIHAEIHQANEVRGHWYIELVEKSPDGIDIAARQSAVLWRRNAALLSRKYGQLFRDILSSGNQVKLTCTLEFHERYGLKLQIHDIDPGFTLGELEMTRRKTMVSIKKEGLDILNKQIPVPNTMQRVAVISSRTAAGWHDFLEQIYEAELEAKVDIDLYHSGVQGISAMGSILENLEIIYERSAHYDLICILRGGGSRLDLALFDEFLLAKTLARAPLPVWSGIGHETDISIVDIVANRSWKTPTALAQAIVDHNLAFSVQLAEFANDIAYYAQQFIRVRMRTLEETAQDLSWIIRDRFAKAYNWLEFFRTETGQHLKMRFQRARHWLELQQSLAHHSNPKHILNKGFTLIRDKQQSVISSARELSPGQHVQILFRDGEATSSIDNIKPINTNHENTGEL